MLNSRERPNVLFILPDQLRADECSLYGGQNIATPNIDRLAKGGVTFTNALATCPLCTPYRGMLMTGRYPTHTGIVINFIQVNSIQNPNCLAQLFYEDGYDTAYIGKWHLSAGRYAHDDAYYRHAEFTEVGPPRLGFEYWASYNFHLNFRDYWYYRDDKQFIYSHRYETDTQFDQTIDYIKNHKSSGKPFFLMLSPHQPHPPYRPGECPEGYLQKTPEVLQWRANVPEQNPRGDLEMRCYLAMVKNIDDNLGRLMNFLEESDMIDSTLVILTSDHGEMHGSHGLIDKMVPYREALHVPLVFHWPGKIPSGKQADILYTPLDHLPTLCSLAGISIPEKIDGMDLGDDATERAESERDGVLIMNYTSHWNNFFSQIPAEARKLGIRCWPEWRGVHTGRYTYAKWRNGREELFDNQLDLYQLNNLVRDREHLDKLGSFRRRLDGLLAEAHDDFPPGTAYRDWYDGKRNLRKTALGEAPHSQLQRLQNSNYTMGDTVGK
jgi:arylsulfatase A-like enzyme